MIPRLLPWKKARKFHHLTNDLLIDTRVKPSNIINGGYGRFANDFIPRNQIFLKKKMIELKNLQNIDEIFEDNKVIKLSSFAEISRLCKLYLKEIKGTTKKEILDGFSDFIASHDSKFCHINTVSLCVNHPPANKAPNVTTKYIKKNNNHYLVGKTLCDIQKGQELYQNYEEFTLPQFFMDFCDLHLLTNVAVFQEELRQSL